MERHPVSFMLDVQVWAVDVSAWHREPYTRPGASQVPALDARLVGAEDATRIGRYVRAIDRVRAFVACLLPRVMLVATQCVGHWRDVAIQRTESGRPCTNVPHIDFNLSHDGDWVVMAFSRTHRVGVDVMQVALPHFEESSASFCHTMSSSMSRSECEWVAQGASEADVLSRLYDVWTYKEALTKNMGLGLGYDFARIDLRFGRDVRLAMDGRAVDTYRFRELALPCGASSRAPGSRVAIALGPRDAWEAPMSKQAVPAQQAMDEGWLRMWTYDAWLDYARAMSGV